MAERPLFSQALRSFKGIQEGTGERLAEFREAKPEMAETMAQPALRQLGERAGLARRSIQGEGSLQSMQRTEIGLDKALGEQDIELKAMSDLTRQEGGLQQLDNQFIGMINEMASTGFQNEMAGLREVMNQYMAQQGAALTSDQLANQARGASMAMWGRFAQAAGMEFGRSDMSTPTQQQFGAAGLGVGGVGGYR